MMMITGEDKEVAGPIGKLINNNKNNNNITQLLF